MQLTSLPIYYDFEPSHGINAYFPDLEQGGYWTEYFSSNYQFSVYCDLEFQGFEVVEITNENYPELVAMGVFNGIL
ncbi:hypothetical protein [Enterovibrio paralichthyis]|uniref:hypothetical protein n=1 Tax=Enterovibrio paralichthyis TaxID=2853805 RepID=UPI001C450AC0|nr:hypothetical protein [Enterovibrio paralichthyis]MBV7296610.1 hypothetical protein [Enterovibrio paralichthyis]